MHFLRPLYDSFFPLNPILRISGPWVGYPHTWLIILWTLVPSPTMYSRPYLLPRPCLVNGSARFSLDLI